MSSSPSLASAKGPTAAMDTTPRFSAASSSAGAPMLARLYGCLVAKTVSTPQMSAVKIFAGLYAHMLIPALLLIHVHSLWHVGHMHQWLWVFALRTAEKALFGSFVLVFWCFGVCWAGNPGHEPNSGSVPISRRNTCWPADHSPARRERTQTPSRYFTAFFSTLHSRQHCFDMRYTTRKRIYRCRSVHHTAASTSSSWKV